MFLLKWIAKLFNLVMIPEERYNNMVNTSQELNEKLFEVDRVSRLAQNRVKELSTIDNLDKEKLQLRNDKLEKDLEDAKEYYKAVQSTLSEALHADTMFKFNGSMAFPGSTVVRSGKLAKSNNSDTEKVVINGRTIFDDATTELIHQATSISEKYYIVINQLVKLNIMNQMIKQLIDAGSIQFTLAYNADCTTCELYYNLEANIPKDVIVIDREIEK